MRILEMNVFPSRDSEKCEFDRFHSTQHHLEQLCKTTGNGGSSTASMDLRAAGLCGFVAFSIVWRYVSIHPGFATEWNLPTALWRPFILLLALTFFSRSYPSASSPLPDQVLEENNVHPHDVVRLSYFGPGSSNVSSDSIENAVSHSLPRSGTILLRPSYTAYSAIHSALGHRRPTLIDERKV
jgi:hypothetical protein